jgi:O-antigen ligase
VSRVAGLSTHYIEYGVVLGMLAPIAVHLALFASTSGQRLVRWGAVVLIVAAVPMSVSRSGILALAVGMSVLAAVWSWRLRYNALIIAMVGVVMFRAVAPGVLGTLRALFTNLENDPSVEGRTKDYAIVVPMIYDRPLWGRGVGTFLPERYIVLDNQVLYTLVSSGVVGLIAFFGLFVSGMMVARSIRRRASTTQDRHLAQALCASIAAGLLASFTFDALGFVQFRSVLCVMLGLVGALWRLSGTRPSHPVVTQPDTRGRITRPRWPDFGWVDRATGSSVTEPGRR